MPDPTSDSFIDVNSVNPIINRDMISSFRDPLNFDLDDQTFLQFATLLKRDADTYWEDKGSVGYNLKERRQIMEQYYFGRQFFGRKSTKYNSKAQDNILWESMSYLRAMATAKMPDVTVTPANDTDEAKEIAQKISQVETNRLISRQRKRVLGLAFKHRPVYLVGVIKVFWNPRKGKYGDIDYKVVMPENVTFDPHAGSNDTKDMEFLFETCEATVKELCMMFPDKEKELFIELHKQGIFGNGDGEPNETNQKGMNSKVKYIEVWFKWYDQAKKKKDEYQTIVGVAWYFKGCLLGKMKHPYWDWQGKPETFSLEYKEVTGTKTFTQEKTELGPEQLMQMLSGQPMQNTKTETTYRNHLDFPKFPYILLGMDQWGKTPIDETSEIEQAIPMQEDYDQTNRQIAEMLVRSRGKHVFSSDQGLKKSDVREMDLGDPYQDVLIAGDVAKMHVFIPGEQPSAPLLQEKQDSRERIFDKMGVHAATRGAANSDTAATNNQINREGDFTRMDDLVDDTITYAAEEMANWDMQLMKLFYTETHFIKLLGQDGAWLTSKIHRDFLEDGMEIVISASGSDKLKAEQRAVDNAKIKMTDPFRYFKDTNQSDPRGRTLALMTFLMNPQAYMLDVKNGGDGTGQGNPIGKAADIINGEISNQGQSPQAMQDIMQIQQGQVPQPPQQVDQNYFTAFSQFMHSQEVEQLIAKFGDQFKQALLQFAQAVSQLAQQQGLQEQPTQPQQPQQQNNPIQQMGSNQSVGPTGPLSQNPSPQNTSRIAAIAPRPR